MEILIIWISLLGFNYSEHNDKVDVKTTKQQLENRIRVENSVSNA